MAYANKYKILFTNRQEDTVTIYILEKDYSGGVTELEAGTDPLVIEFQSGDDNILQPIRGSVANIQYWNNGSYPLVTFASTADDKFKVEVYVTSNFGTYLWWTGFLVQDDCREDFMPVPNIVSLTATDNLALLKEIPITDGLDAQKTELYSATATMSIGDYPPFLNVISYTDAGSPQAQDGDLIVISGGTPFDGSYHATDGAVSGNDRVISLSEDVGNSTATGTITIYRGISILEKTTLIDTIHGCLRSTGLELPLNIFVNVFENNMDDRGVDPVNEPFSQVIVSGKTWITAPNEYEDCYTVLEKIFAAWNCTLFQSKGEWVIVRWPELKQFNNAIPGTRYEFDLLNPTSVIFNGIRQTGKGYPVYPINAGHIQSIVRPNKHTKLTFNYEQPYQLLLNADLNELGELITSYADGSNTVYEYVFPHWTNGFSWTSGGSGYLDGAYTRFIRVIKDATGTELERYAVVKGTTASNIDVAATGSPIEVNEGDVISFSFQCRTNVSQAGPGTIVFDFKYRPDLNTATQSGTKYLDDDGSWDSARLFSVSVLSGENTNQWRTVDCTSLRIPADGYFFFHLMMLDITPDANSETHYKDIQITYTPYVNETTQIIGHIHKSVQNEVVKKKLESIIFVDDAPKNSLRGVMFLEDGTTKTTEWHRGTISEAVKFGYIQKTDLLFLTDSFRKRIEGDFKGLKDNSSYLNSLFNTFEFDTLAGSYFILGQCSFNFKSCVFTGTLEEIWNTSEAYDDTVYTNSFTYIYRTQ